MPLKNTEIYFQLLHKRKLEIEKKFKIDGIFMSKHLLILHITIDTQL